MPIALLEPLGLFDLAKCFCFGAGVVPMVTSGVGLAQHNASAVPPSQEKRRSVPCLPPCTAPIRLSVQERLH